MERKLRQPQPRGSRPSPHADETGQIAAQVLAFLAGDARRLERFFDLTGLTVETLREAAGTPTFEASLLDYLGSDEVTLCAFAAEYGYDPADVDRARASVVDRECE